MKTTFQWIQQIIREIGASVGWPLQRQVVRVSAESPSSSFAIRGTSGQSAHVLPAPSSALNREPDGPCPGSSVRLHSQKVPACTLVGCLCSSAAAAPERAAEFLGSTAPSASPLQPPGQSPARSRPPTPGCGHVMGREAVHRAPCSQDVEADVHEIPQATFSLQKSEVLPSGLPDPVAPCR